MSSVSPRMLQVMMAVLRDRHPDVDLSGVQSSAAKELERLLAPLGHCRTRDFDPAAFPRRMANSMKKLIAASARLHDRDVATEADVALAVEILEPKVDLIRRVATAVVDMNDQVSRRAAIRRQFGGGEASPQEVMDFLGEVSRSTIMRDLRDIGVKSSYGKYGIPAEISSRCVTDTVGGDENERPPSPAPESATWVRELTAAQISTLAPEDVQEFTPDELGLLARDQFEALRPGQFCGFTLELLRQVPAYPFYACLTVKQAAALTPEQAHVVLAEVGNLDGFYREKQLDPAVAAVLEKRTKGAE